MVFTNERQVAVRRGQCREQQVGAGTWHIRNFITAFKDFEFIRPLGPHAPNDRIALEPIGVVGLITPWNWPMNQIALKAIPAILAGCTCVLKPSEESPLNAMIFAEFCHDAGLPPAPLAADPDSVGSPAVSADEAGDPGRIQPA